MKIKYNWEHMHGDADHYDNQELILIDENEIALFDYVTTELKFEPYMAEGFLPTDEQLSVLISLMRNLELEYDNRTTPSFEEFQNNLEEFGIDIEREKHYNLDIKERYKDLVMSDLSEIMTDWKYEVWDVTCGYMHYASIQDFKREDITNVVSTDELLQFIINKYKLNKNTLEQEYLKKNTTKMSDNNQKFVDISMKIPLNSDVPNKDGIIYTRQAYESAIKKGLKNTPIIVYDENRQTIPIGVIANGEIIHDTLLIDGYLWFERYGDFEYIAKDFLIENNTVTDMDIAALRLNIK